MPTVLGMKPWRDGYLLAYFGGSLMLVLGYVFPQHTAIFVVSWVALSVLYVAHVSAMHKKLLRLVEDVGKSTDTDN